MIRFVKAVNSFAVYGFIRFYIVFIIVAVNKTDMLIAGLAYIDFVYCAAVSFVIQNIAFSALDRGPFQIDKTVLGRSRKILGSVKGNADDNPSLIRPWTVNRFAADLFVSQDAVGISVSVIKSRVNIFLIGKVENIILYLSYVVYKLTSDQLILTVPSVVVAFRFCGLARVLPTLTFAGTDSLP